MRFLPEVEIEAHRPLEAVAIKGQTPDHVGSHDLFSLYERAPALPSERGYREFVKIVSNMDQSMRGMVPWWRERDFPEPRVNTDAGALLRSILGLRDITPGATQAPLLDETLWWPLPLQPRPFRFDSAPAGKIAHSFRWIGSNMRLKIEQVVRVLTLPARSTEIVAETAFAIFSLLLKLDRYALARTLSFNFSAYLQARIITYLFGSEIIATTEIQRAKERQARTRWDNFVALELLRSSGTESLETLLSSSVAMGVVWVEQQSGSDVGSRLRANLLDPAGARLESVARSLCVDERDLFLAELQSGTHQHIVVVLDDNGESVFDLAVFQRLLTDVPQLHVTFIVNRFAVSNNISLDVLEDLFSDAFFASLQAMREEGRVDVCIEEQPFTSFEESMLSTMSRDQLIAASLAYIKGVSFFETLQPVQLDRFYAFTVTGMTSEMLTGCAEGTGIFAYVPAGEAGYVVRDDAIRTLRDMGPMADR